MPAKNVVKLYVEDGIYHLYNRGVEKRDIFQDDHDYAVFLNCLKEALSPPAELQGLTLQTGRRKAKNFHGTIELLAYCLMPNHFHLLICQRVRRGIYAFMQSLATRYSIYFNKKYKRPGSLFQGVYRAVLVQDDSYLLHVSRYIHRNPLEYISDLTKGFSSYPEYVGLRRTDWVKTATILDAFQPSLLPFLRYTNSYQSFVENGNDEQLDYPDDLFAR